MSSCLQLAHDLVAIPSMNPMGRTRSEPGFLEAELTDYIERYARSLQIPHVRQPVAPQRENLIAWIPGTPGAPTILFEAHQDTVPADAMTIDPFRPRIEQGKLFGRGSCDVKGAMAAMLAAMGRIQIEQPSPRATVVMACTVDEEHQFTGVTAFLEATRNDRSTPWPRPNSAVVAEPTDLAIVAAHKGVVRWKISTEGRACHSSSPQQGTNAIYRMAKLVSALERFAALLHTSPPHPLLGTPTLSVGRIYGGSSVNVVPDQCSIEIDRRLLPGEHPDQAQDEVLQFLKSQNELDFPIQCHSPWLRSPSLSNAENGLITDQLAAVLRDSGLPPRVLGVPFGTDASKIAARGIPAVVFGPGSIDQAHTCDEWIETRQIELATEVYSHLVRALGTTGGQAHKE